MARLDADELADRLDAGGDLVVVSFGILERLGEYAAAAVADTMIDARRGFGPAPRGLFSDVFYLVMATIVLIAHGEIRLSAISKGAEGDQRPFPFARPFLHLWCNGP
jgi:hypothetical protein